MRTQSARRNSPQFPTRHVVALAFAAYRANNNQFFKNDSILDEETGNIVHVVPNKSWIFHTLINDTEKSLTPTDEDFAAADAAMEDLQQAHMLHLLKSSKVNDFQQNLSDALSQEECSLRDVGILAFVPKARLNLQERQRAEENLMEYAVSSQWLGKTGDKISINFVRITERFNAEISAWSMFGHDGDGNLVQFWTQHRHLGEDGRIQGRIKRTDRSSYHNNAQVTTINYVKRI